MENKTTWNSVKAMLKTAKTKVFAITAGVLLLVIILGIVVIATANNTSEITEETLFPTLELVGELTTAKLKYSGHKEYKDSGLPFLNRSDFLMTYEASLRAGIDVKKIEINVNNTAKTVTVILPDAEIQEVKVDPETIKYYDEKFSLFNFDSKEDANKATEEAEKEATCKAAQMGVLEQANEHAKTLIQELLKNAVPEKYTIIIK